MSVETHAEADAQNMTITAETADELHDLLGDIYHHEREAHVAADTEWMEDRREDRVVAVRETRRAIEARMDEDDVNLGEITLDDKLESPALEAITTYVREEADIQSVPGHVLGGMADLDQTLRAIARTL